jgi:hypothetical protein
MSKAKTTKQVLIAAKWILENKGWCQGYYRKNAQGQDVYDDAQASSFCSIGAIWAVKATNSNLISEAVKLLDKASGSNTVFWNDALDRTKKEVLEGFDKAIKEAT